VAEQTTETIQIAALSDVRARELMPAQMGIHTTRQASEAAECLDVPIGIPMTEAQAVEG
jgi:hypothetical protein